MDEDIKATECLEESPSSTDELRETIKALLEMTRDNSMDVKTIEYTVITDDIQSTIKMEFE